MTTSRAIQNTTGYERMPDDPAPQPSEQTAPLGVRPPVSVLTGAPGGCAEDNLTRPSAPPGAGGRPGRFHWAGNRAGSTKTRVPPTTHPCGTFVSSAASYCATPVATSSPPAVSRATWAPFENEPTTRTIPPLASPAPWATALAAPSLRTIVGNSCQTSRIGWSAASSGAGSPAWSASTASARPMSVTDAFSSNGPVAIRRSSSRCPPTPSASPRSTASVRTYVPESATRSRMARGPSASTISSRWIVRTRRSRLTAERTGGVW